MSSNGKMSADHFYTDMLNLMRTQGSKDNPVGLQMGIMLSETSVKVDDLVLEADDLYFPDYLVKNYSRPIADPYVTNVTVTHSYSSSPKETLTTQENITFTDGLKSGDLVVLQRLSSGKYVILLRVVQVE